MSRSDLPANSTFQQLAARIADHIQPFNQMWPFYWMKAAAVRDGATWHLCFFSLVGRWSDAEPITPMRDQGDALVAVSQLLDAAQAKEILLSITAEGHISLVPEIVATIPAVTLSSNGYQWQEPVQFISEDANDVVEPTQWMYLYASGNSLQWLNDYQIEARIRSSIQPDLDKRNMRDLSWFLASRFARGHISVANQFNLTQFNYTIALPLALLIERKQRDPKRASLDLTIQSRRPLHAANLKVTLGKHWASDAQPAQVAVEVNSDTGWSFANVLVPTASGGIAVTEPALTSWLSYEIPEPSPERQALDVAAFMYLKSAVEPLSAGAGRWHDDLTKALDSKGAATDEAQKKSGARFEVALSNALARLGIPVLFGGQIEREGHLSGPATPGIDLVAIDLKGRRATAISLKAKAGAPSDSEIHGLLDAVEGLRQTLPGWTTFGILACRARANLLGRVRTRDDVRIWSREVVEFISQADSAEAIKHCLWLPPWVKPEDSWAYFSGHAGLMNNPYFRSIP